MYVCMTGCVSIGSLRFFFFVFFFKQKTAYEMRISDWSSDVCSSDLQDPRHEQESEEQQDSRDRERARDVHPLSGPFYQQEDDGGEIGRASCRERVCQYV